MATIKVARRRTSRASSSRQSSQPSGSSCSSRTIGTTLTTESILELQGNAAASLWNDKEIIADDAFNGHYQHPTGFNPSRLFTSEHAASTSAYTHPVSVLHPCPHSNTHPRHNTS